MSVWFEGETQIDCDLERVARALEDYGGHYVEVVGLMPGMTGVELVDQGPDSVTIRTNEGLMKRTHISTRSEPDKIVVEFVEEYAAGSKITVTSHFCDEFTRSGSGVRHRIVITDLVAPGLLGFAYRTFGRSSMGKAFLSSYQACLERQRD